MSDLQIQGWYMQHGKKSIHSEVAVHYLNERRDLSALSSRIKT